MARARRTDLVLEGPQSSARGESVLAIGAEALRRARGREGAPAVLALARGEHRPRRGRCGVAIVADAFVDHGRGLPALVREAAVAQDVMTRSQSVLHAERTDQVRLLGTE